MRCSCRLAYLIVMLLLGTLGCRAHPGTLAMMVVGEAVDDADVNKRQKELMGNAPETADAMFGSPLETLIDTGAEETALRIYRVRGDILGSSRYAVETRDDKIVALSKLKHNIDGMEDIIKKTDLKGKIIGKTPQECQEAAKLKDPLRILRSREKGDLLRVYDVANWTHLGGARYCVLRFGQDGLCHAVRLVGVTASTKKKSPSK